MKSPLVSVIIPTYNRADLALKAVESVWSQTFQDYEILLIDDGSTDTTRQVFAPYASEGKVGYIWQPQAGASKARNTGIHAAQADYLAFLDSDDQFLPGKLEKQMTWLEKHPEAGMVHCWFDKFDTDGNSQGLRVTSWFSGQIYPQLLVHWDVLVNPSTWVIPRKSLNQVGVFNENLRNSEDLDQMRRISRQFSIGVVPERLACVLVHGGNSSASNVAQLRGFLTYMTRAFEEDPALDKSFRQNAMAALYTRAGLNMLANASPIEMREARSRFITALKYRPFRWKGLLGWFASWVPLEIRKKWAEKWRFERYKRGGTA